MSLKLNAKTQKHLSSFIKGERLWLENHIWEGEKRHEEEMKEIKQGLVPEVMQISVQKYIQSWKWSCNIPAGNINLILGI